MIGQKNSEHFLCYLSIKPKPIESYSRLFPRFFNCFELIGSLSCLRLLRLVRVINLVCARRHLETAHVASLIHLLLLCFLSVDWNSFSQCERYSGKKCSVIFINKKRTSFCCFCFCCPLIKFLLQTEDRML